MEHYNLLVVGDLGVGKTTLVIQLCSQAFIEVDGPSIDDTYRVHKIIDCKPYSLDIRVLSQALSLTTKDLLINDNDGLLLVYSTTSQSSFDNIKFYHKMVHDIQKKNIMPSTMRPAPAILVGNMSDRKSEREVSTEQGQAMGQELGCEFVETSAKSLVETEKAFFDVVRSIRRQQQQYAMSSQNSPMTSSVMKAAMPGAERYSRTKRRSQRKTTFFVTIVTIVCISFISLITLWQSFVSLPIYYRSNNHYNFDSTGRKKQLGSYVFEVMVAHVALLSDRPPPESPFTPEFGYIIFVITFCLISYRWIESAVLFFEFEDEDEALETLPALVDYILPSIRIRKPLKLLGVKDLQWRCECGAYITEDLVETEERGLQNLVPEFDQLHETDRAQEGESESISSSASNKTLRLFASRLRNVLAFFLRNHRPNNQDPYSPQHASASRNQDREASIPPLYLLMCIDKGHVKIDLHQSQIQDITDDKQLFRLLRKQYFRYRRTTSWLTLRHVKSVSLTKFGIDSYQFPDIYSHAKVCTTASCECIPPTDRVNSGEYQCDPAPRVPLGYQPALSSRKLTHFFLYPHAFKVTRSHILQQLPKLVHGPLEPSVGNTSWDAECHGWGLYLEEGWHWKSIYFIFVLFIIGGGIAFGVAWAVTKGDVQGAFGVAATILAISPIVLGYIAIRDLP